ncbi:MAG: hypothetical protein HY258_03160 [Chloroflexi bacterium]|nr:hypothetical protein [Chloroflexota bacterium]
MGGPIGRPYVMIGDMKTRFFPDPSTRSGRRLKPAAILLTLIFLLSACAPTSTATPFVPPTQPAQIVVITATASGPLSTPIPTIFIPTPTPPCTDVLTFVNDLTIPDGTVVTPGQSVDKQWLVTNSGTCNWTAGYRLKLVSGSNMGAAREQALYPARAGTQAVLQIIFTAPNDPGSYRSAWQAFNPDGQAFGDTIYIQIIVQ